MALSNIKFANRRHHRTAVNHPSFNSRSSQVTRTNLSVTPTGASVAIRPPRTSLRRMDNRGVGSVGYA